MTKDDKQSEYTLLKDLLNDIQETPSDDRDKHARMCTLIRTARSAPLPDVPEGLTNSVMERLSVASTARIPSLQTLSSQGLGYVFIAFGLFYCIMGVGMQIALSDATAPGLPGWIWRQPRIAMLAALLFGFCGVLLLKRGLRVAKLLYIALTGYILCLAANALQIQLTTNLATEPLGLTFGLIGYVAGGLAVSIFLGDLLRRLPKNCWRKV